MRIKKILLEVVLVVIVTTIMVVSVYRYQIKINANRYFTKLQEQYFDTTYEIYRDEIVGDIIIGERQVIDALFKDIANRRGVEISLLTPTSKIDNTNIANSKFSKTYTLDLGGNKKATLIFRANNASKNILALNDLVIPLLVEALLISFGFLYLWWRFHRSLLSPLVNLINSSKQGVLSTYNPGKETILELQELSETLKKMEVEDRKKAIFETRAKAARQVAHDIRSPLACLLFLLTNDQSLPSEKQTLMRAAIQRITDIVNSLYDDAQKVSATSMMSNNLDNFMIAFLVDTLISEKRLQVRGRRKVQINLDLVNSYGLFARVNNADLKRALSNLIDNSLEAFDDNMHQINAIVNHTLSNDKIQIIIKDDGKGIPSDILHKVGLYGFSYGKENLDQSGSGLGVHYAIKTIKSFGGEFFIESKEHVGTTVTIVLPRQSAPSWFVEKIDLSKISYIVVLDDDQSMHNFWNDKLKLYINKSLSFVCFSSCNEFRKYFVNNESTLRKNTLFLIDYEFLRQDFSGLDLIQEFDLGKQAILVTSYYEDVNIRMRAEKIGLGIIPKGMVAFVPIVKG